MHNSFFLLTLWTATALGFTTTVTHPHSTSTQLAATKDPCFSRRNLFQLVGSVTASSLLIVPTRSNAATGLDLDAYLYKIMRVREATQQERRLISTGKFKDKARQNVKLAVKFMIQNYQLSDSVVGASAYLEGSTAQMRATDIGQAAVQNLQTILEYFDSSDVENIKVCRNGGSAL